MIAGVKSCEACTRAKRKCWKQLPSCSRCVKLRLSCIYQPKPSYVFYASSSESGSDVRQVPDIRPEPVEERSHIISGDAELLDMLLAPSFPADDELPWFLAADTWFIQNVPEYTRRHESPAIVKRFRNCIGEWLRRWATIGECPFVHSRLYSFRFPHVIQDAYSSLGLYFNMTEENEHLVWRIIADRATELVKDDRTEDVDVFEHVARVQALMVYQYIGYFGGNIRQIYLAELRSSTYRKWTKQMLDATVQKCSSGQCLLENHNADRGMGLRCASLSSTEMLWYAWILAETVRRTRPIALGIETVYEILKHGTAPCQGFLMFTSKQGAWAAKSATAWNKICHEADAGFVPQEGTVSLFAQSTPDEVDEFTMVMLEATFGTEMMERWGVTVE